MAADRRAVRSSSRRMTPAPQSPSKPDTLTPPPPRATRRRATRSASRDIDAPANTTKSTRRSARQTSVASVGGERHKDAVQDLATVEESEPTIVIDVNPTTPPRPHPHVAIPHPSPGAASEMSGTTAISSFSIVEAELLEPRLILRHLAHLYRETTLFLDHLVPDDGRIEDDDQHIKDMQMPDSDFVADYNDHNDVLTPRLNRFRGDNQHYISLRAVHRALFGSNGDRAATESGLDLVLYLVNALVFTKEWIHSDRTDKEMWNSLRELDNLFPALFLHTLVHDGYTSESRAGDSALLQETFELALDLRTQLAILYLDREANEEARLGNFNPDEALKEVFFESDTAREDAQSVIRGWCTYALGGEESSLPQSFQRKVAERLNAMRQFFLSNNDSVETKDVVDIEGLSSNFPWNSVILRLLGWIRLRSRELQADIQHHGGVAAIVEKVKAEMQRSSGDDSRAANISRASPRKKRTSFGRNRRRSSRKFDPNEDVSNAVMDRLIAKAREFGAGGEPASSQQGLHKEEALAGAQEHDSPRPPLDDEQEVPLELEEEAVDDATGPSMPPQSSAEVLKLLKEGRKLDKENRAVSLFERQVTAQRVEFGDGFDDSQPAPAPSTRKGKQPTRSSPKKRRLPFEDSDDDDEAFETEPRATKVSEQREKAKRVRIAPSSSGAPTSHQPPTRQEDSLFVPYGPEESASEMEAPEMTEEVPPLSTFAKQKQLAQANTSASIRLKARKARTKWTLDEEDALVEYMGIYPQKYAQILQHDATAGGCRLLEGRTQVNLKDKVRNMAITMIKSGAGLRTGFENVIAPDSSIGKKLQDDGFDQW